MSSEFWFQAKRWLRYTENILFPDLCICCRDAYAIDLEKLCIYCSENLPFTDHYKYEQNEFAQHFWGRVPIDRGAALLTFSSDSGVRDILHRIKYRDGQQLGESMGKLMAIRYHAFFNQIDAIVPVPLHKDKQSLRGYNQCEAIARGLSEEWNVPVWSWALERVKSTETQTQKTRAERSESIMSAFHPVKPDIYSNHHLLLIDDVMTTGATLEACGAALLRGGPVRLSMMTLAMGHY